MVPAGHGDHCNGLVAVMPLLVQDSHYAAAQSITIVNPGAKVPIIRLSLLPPVTGWHLLRIDPASQHPSEIDIVADDEGDGPGEWMAPGRP